MSEFCSSLYWSDELLFSRTGKNVMKASVQNAASFFFPFFFCFLNVSPCRSQQFFSQLLSVMLNISEGCMRWLLDNCAVFLMQSGRINQETKRVHLEQEENLWSWLRAALIVFRLCLCPAEQKFPSIPCQSRFPLISHHVMLPLCIVMKLQCHYDVWCQSLTRYSLIIWL